MSELQTFSYEYEVRDWLRDEEPRPGTLFRHHVPYGMKCTYIVTSEGGSLWFRPLAIPLPRDWDADDLFLYAEAYRNVGHYEAVDVVEALR
jgi:hypothetical protein